MRILLVEDDASQRAALQELLQSDGYTVAAAASAEAALDLMQAEPFDLIVADYQLTGATGSWLARTGARSIYGMSLPAVLITGHARVVDAEGCRLLTKPIAVPHFLEEVRRAFAAPPPPCAAGAAQRIALVAYVNGSLASIATLAVVGDVLREYEESQVAFTTINVADAPAQSVADHRVVALPTLVKTFPAPKVWIAGQLLSATLLRRLLDDAGVDKRG